MGLEVAPEFPMVAMTGDQLSPLVLRGGTST